MRLYSRREFLTNARNSILSLALLPIIPKVEAIKLGRVTNLLVKVYQEPSRESKVVSQLARDELLNVYYEVDTGAGRNSIWYRVWGGYVHSAYIQLVQQRINTPVSHISPKGNLAEVSVPYTATLLLDHKKNWIPNYRLYFGSTHWVVGLEEGPDGEPWYLLRDTYDRAYFARATDLRVIASEELTPISAEVSSQEKHIEVSIEEQTLTAFEYGVPVFTRKISSGVPQLEPVREGEIPSDTPVGHHHIIVKTPSRHMGDKKLTDDIHTTALPGVPWVCFFHETGAGIHGAYWHANFGIKMSHGCVNMSNEDALWIYRWTTPSVPAGEHQFSDWGTRVTVY